MNKWKQTRGEKYIIVRNKLQQPFHLDMEVEEAAQKAITALFPNKLAPVQLFLAYMSFYFSSITVDEVGSVAAQMNPLKALGSSVVPRS